MAKRKNSKTGTKMAMVKAKGKVVLTTVLNIGLSIVVGTIALQAATDAALLLKQAGSIEGIVSLALTSLVGVVVIKQLK